MQQTEQQAFEVPEGAPEFSIHKRATVEGSVEKESSERYISANEYPLLAEIWDNDADAVYDEM